MFDAAVYTSAVLNHLCQVERDLLYRTFIEGDPSSLTLTGVLAGARILRRCTITLPLATINSKAVNFGSCNFVVRVADEGAADELDRDCSGD